jgi:hypothetical protein
VATKNLVVRAGARATERLRAEGFHPGLFGTLVGASGGAKWLVLRHIDQVLIKRVIRPRTTPLDTVGSSIGSFRHACFAQTEPEAALARFEDAYVEQAYEGTKQPSKEMISRVSDEILGILLGETGAEEICKNSLIRSHIIAARLRRDRGRDRGLRFQLQLGAAAALNTVSRNLLGRSFDRILFHSGEPGVHFDDFKTLEFRLTPERTQHALLSSGSIPLLMAGVRSTPGVPGTLFDGGIIDYHFDFEFKRRDGLTLFPHFFDRITPGWFDKPFSRRIPTPEALSDVLFIAPSDEFNASLPGGKVPDRNDFLELGTSERIQRWRGIIEQCRVLGDEFEELIESKQLTQVLQPLPR